MKIFQKTAWKLFFIGLALAFVTTFIYWPVRNHHFVDYDDHLYVSENYLVQQGLTSEGILWAFTTGYAANWHPLTWVSHMMDCQLFGVNPGAHHLVSVLIHVINSLLLLFLLHRLTGAIWKSGLVATLFALHPLHVESVAWISERKDVLSGFFGLLSIWFYAGYARKQARPELGEKGSRAQASRDYILAAISFALGLMAKPMLVTWPFVFLLLDFWPLERVSLSNWKLRIGKLFYEKIPFFALMSASCVVTFLAQRKVGAVAPLTDLSLLDRIETALTAYAGYLGKIFWPQDLAAFYPLRNHAAWEIVGAALVVLLISVVVAKFSAQRPYALTGWLLYVGMLVPVIGLVQVGNQAMADRYTYLPATGIFIVFAWGAVELVRTPKFLFALGIVLIAVCGALTRGQVAYWRDTEALATRALQVTKQNSVMLNTLAMVRIEQGKYDEAIALLSESAEIGVEGLGTLGDALQKAGRHDEAMLAFKRALEVDPNNAKVQNNIGFFLLQQGRLDEAIPHLTAALKSRPEFPEAYYNLGNVWFKKGHLAMAVSHYENAVRFWPQYADAQCNLGMALLKNGKPEAGLPHLEAAIHLRPDFGRAYHHLSEIFFALNRFSESEAASRRAVQLEPQQPLMQYQLALALDAQKKSAEARPIFVQVLEAAKKAGDGRLVREIIERLTSHPAQ